MYLSDALLRETLGNDLKVGDTLYVWWRPQRDQIVALRPYQGNLAPLFPDGAQIASFASGYEMTIDNGYVYQRIAMVDNRA